MIILRGNGEGIPFEATTFPDGTSQVWKASTLSKYNQFGIQFIWDKNEAEIFHLFMLIDLIRSYVPNALITLYMPYLPYARQDKGVDSGSTFALSTFASLLNSKNLNLVSSFDVHSKEATKLINNFYLIKPTSFHKAVREDFKPDVIFYPDAGAALRYRVADNEIMFYGNKVRDQDTGKITGYELLNRKLIDVKDKKILIVDDICDGGATFITAANELMKLSPKEIALCVSHGVFSKGFDEMKAADISKFYYTNSILKNKDGYKVYE